MEDSLTVSAAKSVKEITLSPFERGRIIYKRCRACHSLDIKGKNTGWTKPLEYLWGSSR